MLANINVNKLQDKLKLNIKKQLFLIGTGLMVAVSTVGCGKKEEIKNSCIESSEELVSRTIYFDENVSIRTVENDNFISIYVKKTNEPNYTNEFYSILETELLKGIYTKIELANLDSNFDFSRLDLNGIEMLHLNCCRDDFDYILLSDYHFNTVFINEVSQNEGKLSKVLPHISADEVYVMFDYIGSKPLENYNLSANVKEDIEVLDIYVNNYTNQPFQLGDIDIRSNNDELKFNITTNPSCQIQEDSKIVENNTSENQKIYIK